MSAQSKTHMSPRAQSWYDDVMKQRETIEERAPANLVKLKRTIGLYERIYGMSSAEMREKLEAGEIEETNDLCAWSEHIDLLERVLSRTRDT